MDGEEPHAEKQPTIKRNLHNSIGADLFMDRSKSIIIIAALVVVIIAAGILVVTNTPTEEADTSDTTQTESSETEESASQPNSEDQTSSPNNNDTDSTSEQPRQPAIETFSNSAQVLKVAMQPIQATDPIAISSDSEVAFANAVYDYLVDVDAGNLIQPRLAQTWNISADGLTYTFNLAENVTFHDGSALRSDDVVYSFNRLRDPNAAGSTADLYSNIDAIEAVTETQVSFTLTTPNPFFLFDLSDNRAVVVKEGSTDLADLNGTGPFRVINDDLANQILMARNTAYYIEGQPGLDRLEFIFFADQSAAVDALKSSQVDVIWRVSNSQLQTLSSEAGIVAIDIPTNGFDLVRLRSDQPPGDDPRVVEAMKLATDRQQIWQLVQLGLGAPGYDSPIGPMFSAYYTADPQVPSRDPEAARRLLDEAGYPSGLDLEMHVPNTGGRPDLAVILKEQWAEAGIEVDIQLQSEDIYYADKKWLDVTLGITGWGSRPTPQQFFDQMLECDATWNESKFCDDEFDRLSQIAGSSLDEDARASAYSSMERILIQKASIIIPYFFAQTAATRDHVLGFELKPFAGRTDFRSVSIQTAAN